MFGQTARCWISAKDSRSALAGERLSGPGHLFRRVYLHFIVWSGIRNLCFEEIGVLQACACGESTNKEQQEKTGGLLCWFVCHYVMIEKDSWEQSFF